MLIPPNQKHSNYVASKAEGIARLLHSAASDANVITANTLALSDEELTSWLNSQGPQATFTMFGAHEALGSALNSSLAAVNAILAAAELGTYQTKVDVRPFSDKLAERGRAFSFDPQTGVFAITTIPVEPSPGPEPSPEP